MAVKAPSDETSPAENKRGVIAVCVRHGELLVIQRSQLVVAPGAFCFPGGAMEAGETEEQALVRELREELAAEIRPLRRLWQSQTPAGVELNWWHAALDNPDHLIANAEEVASFHWSEPAALRKLEGLLSSNAAFLDSLSDGIFSVEGISLAGG